MSKQAAYRKFRRSLAEFFDRLVQSAAELGLIYESELMPTLQAWIVAMSSAHMRSFRHTATVIALEVETALCDVAAAVEKDLEVVSRQKEGEKKRKGTGATPAKNQRRDVELRQKMDEVKGRRNKLKEYLNEFFAGYVA
jgi:cohesin complex subunit SA-1/2